MLTGIVIHFYRFSCFIETVFSSFSFSGNAKLNPYIFENLKANYYSFNLNGMSHPGSGSRFDFEKEDYQHLYQNLLDIVGVSRLKIQKEVHSILVFLFSRLEEKMEE